MPISVTCAACSSSFSVKDEYAGKRAKCPKCAEPLTIPAAEAAPAPAAPPVAAPVLARPVVAARVPPKPTPEDDAPAPKRRRDADEDRDDKPAAKRRRGSDEEEDEKPSSKRRRGGDEDETDKPKRRKGDDDDEPKGRRRRRDDDDEPKKKSKALPIILGIVGGLLLLCGGGCAGVWFGVIAPAAEQAKKRHSEQQAELDRWDKEWNQPPAPAPQPAGNAVTEANLAKVRAGMTLAEVRTILGPESALEMTNLMMSTGGLNDSTAFTRWSAKREAGQCGRWENFPDKILVAFSGPLDPAGSVTVVGVIGEFKRKTTEPVKLPGSNPENEAPVTLTADQLSDRVVELKKRTVIISGKVQFATNVTEGGTITLARAPGKKSVVAAFTAAKWNAEWAGKKMQPGDGVTIKGVVGVDPTGVRVMVNDCELLAHTPEVVKPENRTPVATLTPEELGINHAQMKDKWITLKGQYKSTVSGEGASVVLIAPTGKSVLVHPPIGTKFAFKTPPQPLDNLEFTGKVSGSERLMILAEATLVSQSASTEKPTELTADDLTAEFEKDAAAAAKKYEGKLLKVTGPVNSGGNTGARLGLRGLQVKPPGGKIKGYFLDCIFDGDAREAAKGVKLGDQATITGRFGGFKKGTGEAYTITLTTCRLDK